MVDRSVGDNAKLGNAEEFTWGILVPGFQPICLPSGNSASHLWGSISKPNSAMSGEGERWCCGIKAGNTENFRRPGS